MSRQPVSGNYVDVQPGRYWETLLTPVKPENLDLDQWIAGQNSIVREIVDNYLLQIPSKERRDLKLHTRQGFATWLANNTDSINQIIRRTFPTYKPTDDFSYSLSEALFKNWQQCPKQRLDFKGSNNVQNNLDQAADVIASQVPAYVAETYAYDADEGLELFGEFLGECDILNEYAQAANLDPTELGQLALQRWLSRHGLEQEEREKTMDQEMKFSYLPEEGQLVEQQQPMPMGGGGSVNVFKPNPSTRRTTTGTRRPTSVSTNALVPFEEKEQKQQQQQQQDQKRIGTNLNIVPFEPQEQENRSQTNNPLYFDTQYLDPMLYPYSQLITRKRRNDLTQANTDVELVKEMSRLQNNTRTLAANESRLNDQLRDSRLQIQNLQAANAELKRNNEQELQQLQHVANARLQGLIDPLYLYYARHAQENNVDSKSVRDENTAIAYAYFMGLSQIMLEAVSDLARLMVNRCSRRAQSTAGKQIDGRDLLLLHEYAACRNEMGAFMQENLNTNDPDLLAKNLSNFISIQLQANPDNIIPFLFLDKELDAEQQLNDTLRDDLIEYNQFTPDIQNQRAVTSAYKNVSSQKADSDLRLKLINQIRDSVPSSLRAFFGNQGPYTNNT